MIAWDKTLGGGRLCLWTANAYEDGAAPCADFLDGTTITVFLDDRTAAFVGIETDYPAAVLEHEALLRAQPYPLVTLLNAPLRGVHPVDALLWGCHQLTAKGRKTGAEVYNLLQRRVDRQLPLHTWRAKP